MALSMTLKIFQLAKVGVLNPCNSLPAVAQRFMCTPGTGGKTNKPKAPPSAPKQPPKSVNVGGSGPSAVPNTAATETYKVTEYFEHNPYSFYDFNIEMDKMRLPQPSSQK